MRAPRLAQLGAVALLGVATAAPDARAQSCCSPSTTPTGAIAHHALRGGQWQGSFFSQEPRRLGLKLVDGGVFTKNVVAQGSGHQGCQHLAGWLRNRIAAEVQSKRGLARFPTFRISIENLCQRHMCLGQNLLTGSVRLLSPPFP